MTGKAPTICDGPNCGKTKGEGNRWIMGALLERNDLHSLTIGPIGQQTVEILNPSGMLRSVTLDWCSEACLHAYVSRFVTELRGKQMEDENA